MDSHPTPTDDSQLPTPPASHSNVPSPTNSMSPVTPPDYEGCSAKIVSSAGFNTFGDNVSPPCCYVSFSRTAKCATSEGIEGTEREEEDWGKGWLLSER